MQSLPSATRASEFFIQIIEEEPGMEVPGIQLEWRQEKFLLTSPPEMLVVQWNRGQLEILAPPPGSYVIKVLGNLSPAPVMRTGEEEDTE